MDFRTVTMAGDATTAELIIAADDILSREGGSGTPEDWRRLRESFLVEYPVCPDCQSPWDLDLATEQVYPLDGEIGILAPCPATRPRRWRGVRHRDTSGRTTASSVTASPCLDLDQARRLAASGHSRPVPEIRGTA